MVNTHERPDVVSYRKQYVSAMWEKELSCACWFHMPVADYLYYANPRRKHNTGIASEDASLSDEDKEKLMETARDNFHGHLYNHEERGELLEIHVDAIQEYLDGETKRDQASSLGARVLHKSNG